MCIRDRCNYETIKWVAEAAGRERIPVIIQFYPGFEKYIALKHVAAIAKEFAEKSEVPIGVHLDHSAGYGIAVGGVRDGFPSVMVDGSALPYEAVSYTHLDVYKRQDNHHPVRLSPVPQGPARAQCSGLLPVLHHAVQRRPGAQLHHVDPDLPH